ncbi:MAG: transporter substrate-binding domain-containing protein [Leptotrichiaceae bacterium]|nr:transporter substrate-binding domain-containing protein [Leptotrichiaceae bacterium]
MKVGIEGVFLPFTFTDETGKLTGYDVEVVEEIGKRAGLDVEFIPTLWDSMFLGLELKKV